VDLGKLAPKARFAVIISSLNSHRGVAVIVLGLSAYGGVSRNGPRRRLRMSCRIKATANSEPPIADDVTGPVVGAMDSAAPETVAAGGSSGKTAGSVTRALCQPPPRQYRIVRRWLPLRRRPPPNPRDRADGWCLQAQVDSWADVRDAHGNRLLYETIAAGRTVAVEGATPLAVFLGNGRGYAGGI